MAFKRQFFHRWGPLAISALAIILIAAGVELDQNWARLRALPKEQRLALVESLRRFDLVLKPEDQKALVELDRQIAGLEPSQRNQYLASLRRYHNWLSRLPEQRRDELNASPPAERMALVKKIIADNHPVPKLETGMFLRIADLGEFSPFELAAVFKVWQLLTPTQRQAVEKMPRGARRVEAIFAHDQAKEIGREVKPDEFDEHLWLGKLETELRKNRPAFLLDELKKKAEPRYSEILRRQAINFYFRDRKRAPVDPDRLSSFVAAFPSFIQNSFEQFPPDEARRRLCIVYRLVFPPGTEMKPAQAASVSATGSRAVTGKQTAKPKSPERTQGGANPSPF